jgi:YjbR
MATAMDLRKIAISLDGTTEAPHFDRAAFKVKRIYVTFAADELTANFKFDPCEQQRKCLTAPEAFAPVANAWGKQGWTTATLAALTAPELKRALAIAWRHAI